MANKSLIVESPDLTTEQKVLGPDTRIEINAYDEYHTVIPLKQIVKRFARNGNRGVVCLVGVQSNAGGLGARVSVDVGENPYVQVMDGKSGYLSQSDLPLYFGLDKASSIDQVRVLWPSGRETIVDDPAANRLLVIREDDAR